MLSRIIKEQKTEKKTPGIWGGVYLNLHLNTEILICPEYTQDQMGEEQLTMRERPNSFQDTQDWELFKFLPGNMKIFLNTQDI